MTTGVACPPIVLQFFGNNGAPLAGGSILTQVGGVNTAVYQDSGLTTPLPNPIPLNSRGEVSTAAGTSSQMFLTPNQVYTFTASDAGGNQIWVATYVNGVQVSITQAAVGQALWPRTGAEIAAGVTPANYYYAPTPMDVRRYGADPTGVNVSDAAFVSAIEVAGLSGLNGGRIYIPAGIYTFNNPISLYQAVCIRLEGDGAMNSGSAQGTTLKFLGSGADFIQMTNASGCSLKGMTLVANNAAMTNALVHCGGINSTSNESNLCFVEDCYFNGSSTNYHLNLDQCIEFFANRCNFGGGETSVKGQSSSSSFSNVIRFTNCQWVNCGSEPIGNLGQAWSFHGCTFEALSNGEAGAINNTVLAQNISIRDCWFGDATVSGGTWLTLNAYGIHISGCNFQGQSGSTAISLNPGDGFTIRNNLFFSFATAINFAATGCVAGDCSDNIFSSVTTTFGNTANSDTSVKLNPNASGTSQVHSAGSSFGGYGGGSGWEYNDNQVLRQWGSAGVTVSGGTGSVAITFPKAFGTGNLGAIQAAPTASCTWWLTNVSTTGFTFNVSGASANLNIYWTATGF